MSVHTFTTHIIKHFVNVTYSKTKADNINLYRHFSNYVLCKRFSVKK